MKAASIFLALSLLVLLADGLRADEAGIEFFEKKIRPILVEHCYECHSAGAKKLGGQLRLDHRAGLLKGGESGAAIEPGQPEKSLLVAAIRYEDEAFRMPPSGKLPAAAIADLEAWIRMGAPDPRRAASPAEVASSWDEILASRRNWWSLQSVRKPPVPQPSDAVSSLSAIDHFIQAKLDEQGLEPAKAADPRTLARRLSLVLTGLPPNEMDVEGLAQGGGQLAIGQYVDRLLASPHFGERWARHWMDVVRFTETHGNEWNYEVHHAWRYRDYLIRAFNDDVPYDQFVREHIAGDLLPKPRWNRSGQFNESIIGTAFYRFGEVNHDDCISLRQIGYDLLDNQIDTLTKAFQATTVACARCHDHKLDAVSMHDYYALLGVMRSSRLVSHTIDSPEVNAAVRERLRILQTEIRSELSRIWRQEATHVDRYMQAAHARRAVLPEANELAAGLDKRRVEKWVDVLRSAKLPLESPLAPWQTVVGSSPDPEGFADAWRKLAERYEAEGQERLAFNERQFVTWADFRRSLPQDWQTGGQGLRDGPAPSGELVLNPDGVSIAGVLPAGAYTHRLSQRLNGTIRSPVVPLGKKHISFQVLGQRSSAVRLVSNHCQLNYKNYRALTSPGLAWVTFDPPEEAASLRTYAELMTMLDNPKFPDQLSALGGDTENYRLPWEKAAENPNSYFGITRVVLHDCDEPPRPELSHFRPLFAGPSPQSLADLAGHYAQVMTAAIDRWQAGQASDDDVRWIDDLLQRGLLESRSVASDTFKRLIEQYRDVEGELARPRIVPGIADCGPGFDQPVFTRGDCLRPSDTVPRRYLEVLAGSRSGFPSTGSGRLELAERIASPDNPLTARVMVNRVWHHLFGTGLVRTVDDFGHVGELPSHAELLDHLAAEFIEDGWSVKRLIRRIVLTRTFQLASQPPAAAGDVDPQNRLLSHYPARRLEAEAIRDAVLAASGRLDATLYGMSIQPFREREYAERRLFPGPLDGHGRRSIYIKNNLMEAPKFLGAFNLPGGKVTQGRRDVTNVPAQALALMNDPFVVQQADRWAQQLVTRSDESLAQRIEAMFRTALGRPPTDAERTRFAAAAVELARLHAVSPEEILRSQLVWMDLAHAIYNLQEFVYIP